MADYTLHCGDCLDILPTLEAGSIDLIVTDPPYFKVKKDEPWDRQWESADGFLAWLDRVLVEFARILKPNGSLYLFASPKMAARVEVLIGQRFNVINHITWAKPSGRAEASEKEALRGFFPQSERIIFAEHFNSDNYAQDGSGYEAECDRLRGFVFEPLRAYLDGERQRAGVSKSQCNGLFDGPNVTQYWWQQRNWQLPIKEHYERLRAGLSRLNHGGEYLRREYEDLRRPFSVTADVPYTDVWTFPTVGTYPGKHVCEKPLEMMQHIVSASSREGARVLDCFMGSGNVGVACVMQKRQFVGIDASPHWYDVARQRLEMAGGEFVDKRGRASDLDGLPLLAGISEGT